MEINGTLKRWLKSYMVVAQALNRRPSPVTMREYKAAVDAGEQLFYPGEWAANIVDDDGSCEDYTS